MSIPNLAFGLILSILSPLNCQSQNDSRFRASEIVLGNKKLMVTIELGDSLQVRVYNRSAEEVYCASEQDAIWRYGVCESDKNRSTLYGFLGYQGSTPCPSMNHNLSYRRIEPGKGIEMVFSIPLELPSSISMEFYLGYILASEVPLDLANSFSLHGAMINQYSELLYFSKGKNESPCEGKERIMTIGGSGSKLGQGSN